MSRTLPDIRSDKAQLSAIFDGLSVGVLIFGLDGAILGANEGVCALFASDPETMRGRPVAELFAEPPSVAQDVTTGWLRGARAGSTQIVERQCRTDNGRAFWAEFSVRRIDLGGQAVGLAVIRDISGQKLTIDALMQASRRDLLTELPNPAGFRGHAAP